MVFGRSPERKSSAHLDPQRVAGIDERDSAIVLCGLGRIAADGVSRSERSNFNFPQDVGGTRRPPFEAHHRDHTLPPSPVRAGGVHASGVRSSSLPICAASSKSRSLDPRTCSPPATLPTSAVYERRPLDPRDRLVPNVLSISAGRRPMCRRTRSTSHDKIGSMAEDFPMLGFGGERPCRRSRDVPTERSNRHPNCGHANCRPSDASVGSLNTIISSGPIGSSTSLSIIRSIERKTSSMVDTR